MRTEQTEGRRWSIWLPLLLQSFKHDAVLDAESEIGWSTVLVSFFWVVCGLTKILSGYHQILTTKKKNPRHSVSLEFWCDKKLLIFLALCRFSGIKFPVSHIHWKYNVELNAKHRKGISYCLHGKNRDGARTKLFILDIYNQTFMNTICVCMCDI